jgi:hypothetical protein
MDETLRKILSSPEFAPNIVEERLLPASEGSFAPMLARGTVEEDNHGGSAREIPLANLARKC